MTPLGEAIQIHEEDRPHKIIYYTNDDNGVNWIKIGDTEQRWQYIYNFKKIKPSGVSRSRFVKDGDFLYLIQWVLGVHIFSKQVDVSMMDG